ncbi:NACHT domain-containing protein [Tardiphaga sp. 813_E8_N1_3]|uniref:NACHT domain-containing protein n=1 Tax=Tardiphaga sp. 813_E8_N1_3 TaxID=3240760 RepID=UPI003F25DCE6
MTENNIKARFQFFSFYSATIVLIGLVLFFVFSSAPVRALIAATCVLLIWLGFRLATFTSISDNRVRVTILSASTVLLFATLQYQHSLDWLWKPLLIAALTRAEWPIPDFILRDDRSFDYLSAIIIAAWTFIAFLALRSLAPSSAMGVPQSSLNDLLPNITNLDRLQNLKRTLRDKLDHLDFATRWNESNYVSLEAEVQILEGRNSRRKVVDLLRALRINPKTRLFIVLGEPGTGKSVALRKLTRDLLIESAEADRIPLYINLKEWKTSVEWSATNKPTVQQFHDFVYNNLVQNLDFVSQAFLTPDNYRALLEGGYFFFVLDSFDEIPAVLDHDENSWIISDLSNCIATYVLSGENSRGIISSRLFRQPKLALRERSVFEIQPFSDDRIIRAITLASNNSQELIRTVLTERNDLGSIARNPFLLQLIINHFNQIGTVPNSQAEMFETFIDTNIKLAKDAYGMNGLSEADIYSVCEDIAAAMFERTRAGLEIGNPELSNEVQHSQLPTVIQFLSQARMARIAPVSGAFSFSHRRFNEYFLVRRLRSNRTEIPFDAIQNDSRWRDALVLYAEIADDEDAAAMVQHGWKHASQLKDLSLGLNRAAFVKARHALRFLVEGFRNRPYFLKDYQAELGHIIRDKLAADSDYIEKKTVLESLALMPTEPASFLIVRGLDRYPGWISEEAAGAARYLNRVSPSLATKLYAHCVNRKGFAPLIEARRQLRILAISDAFRAVTRLLRWYLIDVYKSFAGLVLLVGVVAITQDAWWLRTLQTIAIPTLIIPLILPFSDVLRASNLLSKAKSKEVIERKKNSGFLPSRSLEDYAVLPKIFAAQAVVFSAMFSLFLAVRVLPETESTKQLSATPWTLHFSIALISLFIVIPFRPTFWQSVRRAWSRSIASVARRLATVLFTMILLLTIVARIPHAWISTVVFCLAALGCLAMSAIIGRAGFQCLMDFRDLKEMKLRFAPDRTSIARDFLAMRTSWGRVKYVAWIGDKSVDAAEAFRRETNIWPNGRRPQYDGDQGSMLLAQLDARWLDLN